MTEARRLRRGGERSGGGSPLGVSGFWGTLDPACPVEFAGKLGGAVRASRVVEPDCNHWTVVQKPAEVAAALEAHWTA